MDEVKEDDCVSIGQIEPTPIPIRDEEDLFEQSTKRQQRKIWKKSETQSLFDALAEQGKTLEQLASAVGTRSIEQVYCKLQNTRTKFKNNDPEIRRVLREEFHKYRLSVRKRDGKKNPQLKRCKKEPTSASMEENKRRIWTREEMEIVCETLRRFGTSVSAITQALDDSRTNK